jgi:hypothetical protein
MRPEHRTALSGYTFTPEEAEEICQFVSTAAYGARRIMKIDELTIGEAKQLASMFAAAVQPAQQLENHPMLGKRCLIRTYSAGVHIGDVVYVNGMEVKLANALRLWKWEGGGLSLSAVANNGIKKGRLNKTGEVYLTNAIEFIPTTSEAEATYARFIED